MKLGINMDAYPCSVDERISFMKKYGFEATFSMADAEDLDETVRKCKEAGIVHENLHAPFRGINAIWTDTPEGEEMLVRLLLAVDAAARNGIPILVVHLCSGECPPLPNELGLLRFEKLMRYAKERSVTIAYENQRYLSVLSLAFEKFPDARFCFDTGHEACFTKNLAFLPIFGEKTVALHVHDNHAVYNGDEHMLPFDGTIDFSRVMHLLAQTPYVGALMLEVVATHSPYYKNVSADEYYARAYHGACHLREFVLSCREK